MDKIFRYKDLSFPVADNDDVVFSVEFGSHGNMARTTVNLPGPDDPEIIHAGEVFIGKGKSLRVGTITCICYLSNPVPQENRIKVRFKINGELMVEYDKPKSESKEPFIYLFIDFPKP